MPYPSELKLAVAQGVGNTTGMLISGVYQLIAFGTFAGGTAKLQISPDAATTWIDYPSASFTGNSIFVPVYLGDNTLVRINVAGGTPSINVTLFRI